MKVIQWLTYQRLAHIALLIIATVSLTFAQVTTGNVRGIVKDPNGAVIQGANVTLTDKNTNTSQTTQTTGEGEYQFNNLLPGDYTIKVEAANFKMLTLTDVRVELNQTTDIPSELQIGGVGESVEVSAGGAELVETTTTTLSKSFDDRQVVELAQTSLPSGVNNLSLIAPNVSTAGGIGVGTGGSVGGQRPRNNNFIVDGVDNNDKGVTGPQSYVSPEEVAEFTLLQNQFSAEFGRSNGGQFITVTKSGTNDFHGTAYGFIRNRYLNALDVRQKEQGVVRERSQLTGDGTSFFPRSDYGRFGFNIGGPLYLPRFGEGGPAVLSGKDRLFFFTSYERLQTGNAAGASGVTTPTAEGFATLSTIPGLSPTNLSVFRSFAPVAPINNDGFITVAGTEIPVGLVTIDAPNFTKQNHFLLNMDFVQSQATQHRVRFSLTNFAGIDTDANLPIFFASAPNKQRLFSYTLTHTFTANLTNETRFSYRRSEVDFPVPSLGFPGLDTFPNIGLFELGLDIGPNPNAPQFNIENNYQLINNLTYLAGNHTLKFGGDFRNLISPQRFVQRERGDYQYLTLSQFLFDISPDRLAERNVGGSTYYGNQKILYAFVQDDWRVTSNLTLNLGLGYSYQQIPEGTKLQALNSIASVPGLIEFREPKSQKKNFAPKIGLAYSPNFDSGLLGRFFGSSGKSSFRLGASIGYDYIPDNFYVLSRPPQAEQTIDVLPEENIPNFLANGGIPNVPRPIGDAAATRRATGTFIPDQEVPYSITYTASFQRQFLKDWAVEVRYLGTRGVHLLTQNRLNSRSKLSDSNFIPTFMQRPSAAQVAGLRTFSEVNSVSPYVPRFEAAGFDESFVVGFLSNGNSTYNSGSIQLQRRLSDNLQFTSAYTYSHLIDDSTAEVFSTALNPRRVEDFQNLRTERADSALDRRHRFVASGLYELPFFNSSNSNRFARFFFGGLSFAGTFSLESGQKATVLSGVDSNLNGDSAGDRAIRNPNGVRGTGSIVNAVDRNGNDIPIRINIGNGNIINNPNIVAYYALNPSAEYIQAQVGARSNSGRNTLQLPGINNLDFSIFKNFHVGENSRIQIRADLFNAFNHAQFIPGSPNDVTPINTTGVGQVNTLFAGNDDFNRPERVFSSNPRVIQLALRFNF